MDSNQGVPFWPQPDFETQSPWVSITPTKPAPVDDQMNQPPYGMGFLDLLFGNYDGDFFQSILPPDSNSSSVPDYADQFPHRNTKGLFPGSDSYAVGQVQDLSLDSGAAAGLGYSGYVQGPQISGDDLGPGTATLGDPSDGWQRTTHTNLIAYADAAAVANKAPFFTPLLLSQIEGGCTMPIAPEQPSINGNEMVSSSLYNSDLNLMTQRFFSSEPELDENTSEPDINKHMPIQPQNLPQNAITLGHVNEMANRKGCTPSQLTLAWLHHQGGDVFPIPGATGFENFNQNIAPLSVELTPEEMAELESYASANDVKDDRYAQETTDTGNRYLMPQYTWTAGSLEIKRPLQTHTPPEFINMDNRDLMPQYPWTPARTEKHWPLQTQMPTEFNTGNRYFMPQSPWTPKNQEINRPPDTRMPPEIIDLVDDLTSEQNNWEEARKSQTSTAKQAKLCLLEPLAPPPLTPLTPVSLGAAMPFESALVQQQHADTEGVVSSAEAIDQATTAETQDLLENDGIDLNKAPQKKPKRKKHRPKVIREGKPARTPKPATPKTKNPSGKRKYVRKNKTEVALETLSAEPGSNDGSRQEYSSQKQHHKRKNHPKNSPENPYSNPGVAAELVSRYRKNSVRRQLDFNDEVARDAYPRSTLMLTNNVECQYREAYHARNAIKTDAAASVHQTKVVLGFPVGLYSSTNQEANEHLRLPAKNFQPCGTQSMRTDHILDEFQTREQQAVGNLVPGFPSGLYSSANQEANEHSRLAHKVQPCRTESVRTDQILDEFRIPENPVVPPQISKRENMKRLARKSFLRYASNSDRSQEPDIIQLDSLKTSDMPRKRRISDYILDNNAQNLMIINSIQAADRDKKLNRSHNARHHDTYLSQVYNKQGTEHENRFTLKTASSLMCTPSNDFRRHQVKSDTAKAFIYTDVKTQLASEDMLLLDQPENITAKRSKLALVPYSHSSINSAQETLEQNKFTAPLESFPCNYKQYSTKSRMKGKAEIFIHTNQEDLQGQKSLCYPLDDVIQMLRHLTLNKSDTAEIVQAENAIVQYGGNLALVPYEPKKPRPRAKVDLDPETNRVWNRLMGKEVGEDQETEVDKVKWEEERRLFSVRVDSFIDRMHLVQGDRRFSKWKGSVVDSVVGVFLTQNVSDHLSSSAFMALAARFPQKSRCKNFESSADESESCMKHEDSSIETVKGNNKWQEQISSDKHLHGSSPLVIATDNEIANSNESFGSNSSDTVANYTKVRCVDPKEKVIGISHDSPASESSTPITLTSINLTEAEDRWSVEDVGSSQNSSENPHQVADQIRITYTGHSNCVLDASDQPCSRDFAAISGSVPVADLLDIFNNSIQPLASAEAETYTRKQFYSANNVGTDLNEAPFAEHISKQNDSVFEIHKAVQSQLQNQNFDNQQNSAVSEAVFQSQCVGDVSDQPYSHFSERANINKLEETRPSSEHTGNISEVINQQDFAAISGSVPVVDLCGQNCMQLLATAEVESYPIQKFTSPNNHETNLNVAPLAEAISQHDEGVFEIHSAVQSQHQKQNFEDQQNSASLHNTSPWEASKSAQLDLKDDAYILKKATDKTPKIKAKEKKVKKNENERNKTLDWDSLRKGVDLDGSKERSQDTMDSVDWEAVRSADVKELSQAIKERGMNNMLAERIKEFLDRLVNDHGSIDLEWLRKIEPGKAKDYLLSIRGLGLKSVECVRLLTLHNLAFPVDTNVGRICVRLGWVPLQPLPESVQLHLLELYPVLETIQRYLWPRLCQLDQRTLYELHYQLITFGKVFCTKSKPNCNACPMRGDCKHFASAFASATLKLTGPEEKSIVSSNVFAASQENHVPVFNPTQQIYQLEGTSNWTERVLDNCQPIIEEPASPEPECTQIEESEIEDAFYEDPDEIPTIKLNIEEFTQNLQGYMQANNMEIQDVDMTSNLALMITKPEHASIPMPKLKNVSRLRTEHLVYELPDSHPLLEGFEPRESDDPSSYLLAIWTAGETAQSTEPPKESCNSDETGVFCNMATCFTCSHRRELQAQIVRGTILIPCRTAMRGSFPLNGTYFQVNEVFADHDSSRNPIDVPREWIWNLPRRTVFFGTSVTSIFKGLTTEHIQSCFWRGCVCVRGFDRKTRAPRPLYARLHFSASKAPKNKQQEKGSSAKTNNTSQKGSIIS